MSPRVDANALAAVHPGDIANYLRATGWRQTDHYRRMEIWTADLGESDVDVLIPSGRVTRDYPRRMYELLTTVAEHQQRTPEDVLHDLLSVNGDVQYVRTMPESPSGTTPLHQGYQAVKGVHDLFLAAATSSILDTAAAVLPSSKPKYAWDFLNGVRLGQTAPGSYILRVETPLSDPAGDEEPNSRKVLEYLHGAVRSARDAGSSDRDSVTPSQRVERDSSDVDSDELAPYIEDGVSANLCEALYEIGARANAEFELSFAWAPLLPVERETPALHFDEAAIARIGKLGQRLRDLRLEGEAEVVGRIVELRSRRPNQRGVVTVEGSVRSSAGYSTNVRVLVSLSKEQYDQAPAAHLREQRLRFVGQLKVSGRQPELLAVHTMEPPR